MSMPTFVNRPDSDFGSATKVADFGDIVAVFGDIVAVFGECPKSLDHSRKCGQG